MDKMEHMERPVTVKNPRLRAEIFDVAEMLSVARIQRFKVPGDPDVDFNYCVHILFDDSEVMSDPASDVGWVLFENETADFEALRSILEPLIDELGDVSDEMYLTDPRWLLVQEASKTVALRMQQNGQLAGEP